MIAATSATPIELFAKLKYEGHPGLWHLLLWVITRFSSDPFWMQVLHLVIALGIWLLIWRASPFRPVEKLLLLLSYYLFWEYFVVSRSYALGVLLGFGYVALRTQRPTQRFWPWVLLGLLANTTVFGAIWSLGMAAFFALGNRREWRAMVAGAALYAALVVLAIATMMPAPDVGTLCPGRAETRCQHVRHTAPLCHRCFLAVVRAVRVDVPHLDRRQGGGPCGDALRQEPPL